jgi:hypothetical protein
MVTDLLPLVVGFLLTSVLGGLLGYLFQRRSWAHQHEVQQRDQERQQALRTFEEVSRLLDRRLYRMRRLYWAARGRALGTSDQAELGSAQAGYREVLFEWNDNLNRTLALVHTYFGSQVREQLEEDVPRPWCRSPVVGSSGPRVASVIATARSAICLACRDWPRPSR